MTMPLTPTPLRVAGMTGRAALIAAIVVVAAAALPLALSNYQVGLATEVLIFGILAMSIDILAGFAGSAADSFALFTRFEAKLEQYRGNLERSSVELAKDWRSDRILRRLEAMLVVLDKTSTFLLSGNGDLIEPDDGIVAIGSGGPYALAAAKALAANTDLDARAIAEKGMAIAAEICIYTNANIVVEEL